MRVIGSVLVDGARLSMNERISSPACPTYSVAATLSGVTL